VNIFVLVAGLLATVIACLCVALLSKWGYCLVVVIIYVVMAAIVNKITKELSNKYLKQAQFMLAIVCRSENNRVFLFHNIEMRPGYLGKWIEFITHDSDMDYDNIFDIMKVRQDRIKYSEFLDELLARVPEKSVPKMS
jgi:hypothetical protein